MSTFPDVNAEHWAYDDIEWSAERGIFRGYPDGRFHPDNPLERDETAAVLRRTVRLIDPSLAQRLGVDTQAPIIALNGPNPQQVAVGDPYSEWGATAVDNVDGDLTDRIVIMGDPDTSSAGEYTVSYTVRDTAGNAAAASRTVKVVAATGWGDGILFGDRPPSSPIHLIGARNEVVEGFHFADNLYQSDGTNRHVCILLDGCENIVVRFNDFQLNSEPIAIVNGGRNIVVEYNRCDGIQDSNRYDVQTGNFIQTVGGPEEIIVRHNKILGGDTEDIISSYSARGMIIEDNQIDGTGWSSDSGTGIICGDGGGADVEVRRNTLLNPGQVGIAAAGGTDHLIENNIVYSNHDAENVGMYHANYYPDLPFGGTVFRENRVKFVRNDNGFWGGQAGYQDIDNNWSDDSIDPADLIVTL